jgi:long-chain acyl-CoA synthetase
MQEPKRLFDIPYYQLAKYPKADAFTMKIDGQWIPTSMADFIEQAKQISQGLIALGVQPGDRVGLISPNRVEWNILDIAIQQAGAINVPIYPNISTSDYRFIFNDAEIKICFVGNQEIADKITPLQEDLSFLKHIYSFDKLPSLPHWEEVKTSGKDTPFSEVQARMDAIKHEDLATMIYTSGTTGQPKGVMLSHRNILSNVEGCVPRIPADEKCKALTFLPACHVYERMLHYLYMYIGTSIYYAESLETIGDNIREVKPEIFTAVPRLIEKVFDKIMAKGEDLTGIKRKLFFWAVSIAEEFELEGKSWWYGVKLWLARKLIFSKWQEALGGNVRAIASGSAALQPRLARIFYAAQIPILEGYGLTETSPVVSVNCFQNGIMFGSVGPLIHNVEVKFAPDGEILVKGPNVMMGYYRNEEKTKEVLDDDGWFHTGDIGEMVNGKLLKITDRKKEIFKTSGGKYIAPQVMENKFKASRFIEQIMVIGENQKHPAALVVPSFAFVREWAHRKEIEVGASNAELISNPKVIARIQREIDIFNEEFGKFEQIKKFELLDAEMTVETGEMTPTLKFKRKFIMEKYAHLVQKIYGE